MLAAMLGFVCAGLFLALPAFMLAREKQPKSHKLAGLATAVEPSRVTILGQGGMEVTVRTEEDFTEKVAVGSKVTAWYHVKDGVSVLEWLQYPLENFFLSAGEIRSQVKKIIILSSSSLPNADGLFDAMAGYLKSNLGWYVAPQFLAEEIRKRLDRMRTSGSTLQAINPSTGEFDFARYLQTQRELTRKLASEARVDAVLEANVEQVQAEFDQQVAFWDGVEQPVASKGSRTFVAMLSFPMTGEVPAATVVLKLRDAQGKLLWSKRRGFAVLALEIGVGKNFRDRPLAEALEDQASVGSWLAMVFGSFLPAKEIGPTAAKQ